MVLNSAFFLKNIAFKLVVLLILNYFNSKYFSHTWRVDTLLRANLNDFFLLNFFFFWTNVWYLPKFLTVMLVSFCMSLFYFVSVSHTLLLQLLAAAACLLLSFNTVSYVDYCNTLLDNSRINLLLLNKINRVHPPLFYLGFFIYVIVPLFTHTRKFQQNYRRYKFILHCSYSFLFLSVSLYLGGWWASQEGSWGGWWNWDSSEVFGLCLFYAIVRGYHSQLHLSHGSRLGFFSLICAYSLLAYYFLMQLNFTLVSHNFGFRKKHFLFEKLLMGAVLLHSLVSICRAGVSQFSLRKFYFGGGSGRSSHALFLIFATQLLFLVALVSLVNYNFYLDAAASTNVSALIFTSVLIFFVGFALRWSILFVAPFYAYSSQLQAALSLPLRSAVSDTWVWQHFMPLFTIFIIFFYVNKAHSWFSFTGYVTNKSPHLHPCHASLFFSESPHIEVFKKLGPPQIFKLSAQGKVSYQSMLTSLHAWYPVLNTLDYSIPYLSHIPAYVCLSYLLVSRIVSVL